MPGPPPAASNRGDWWPKEQRNRAEFAKKRNLTAKTGCL